MPVRNQVKPDTILKTFWKNNQRFADLFNTVLFEGNPVLKPNDLQEVDTDVSSIIKFNGHAETVQRILDVVRKTAYGVDFIIWGLENQEKIHYAMPLRHMIGDSLIYLKEYNEIAAKNRKEKEWDGPFNLLDMLVIPEYLKPLVSDYRMNLIQVRQSENLCFQNQDISIVFDMIRSIYNKDYETFHEMYKDKTMSTELGLTVGSVVKSQAIINEVMKMEEKRSEVDMCDALQRWFDEAVQKGKIEGVISTCRRFHISREETVRNLIEEFSLSKSRAEEYIKMYW